MEWPVIKTRKMAQNNKHKEAEPNAVENLNAHLTQAGSNIQKHKKTILWVVGIIVLAGAFAGISISSATRRLTNRGRNIRQLTSRAWSSRATRCCLPA